MKKPFILVVDDDPAVRSLLRERIAKNIPCKVEAVGDGLRALQKIKKGNIDLVILDINMPGLSGIDVIKKIKGIAAQLKIIALSAYDSMEIAKQAIDAGALDYILKNYTSKEIEEKIKKALA